MSSSNNAKIILILAFKKANLSFQGYFYYGIPYDLIYCIFDLILGCTLDILLLSLYIRALYIYSNHWSRIDDHKYEPNPFQHEILIIITRYIVVFSTSCFIDTITSIFGVINVYLITPYDKDFKFWVTFSLLFEFFVILDIITYIIAIYSSYEFGYRQYRRFCSICHGFVYNCNVKKALRDRDKKWFTFKQINRVTYTDDGYILMTE